MMTPIQATVDALRDAGLEPRVTWTILLGYVGLVLVYRGGQLVAEVYVDHGRASVQRCAAHAAPAVHTALATANGDVALA